MIGMCRADFSPVRPSHLPCVGRSVASANICHRPPSWGTHYIRHTIGSTDSLQIELLLRPPGDKYQEIIELHLQSIFPYNNKYCDCVSRQENVYKYDGEDRHDSQDSCDSGTWHQLLTTQTTPGTCLSLSLSRHHGLHTQHSSHLSSLLYWSSMFSPLTGSLVSGSSLLDPRAGCCYSLPCSWTGCGWGWQLLWSGPVRPPVKGRDCWLSCYQTLALLTHGTSV